MPLLVLEALRLDGDVFGLRQIAKPNQKYCLSTFARLRLAAYLVVFISHTSW